MRAVVFSGTTEGRIFSRQLAQFGADILVSVATPLGSEEQGSFAGITVHCGRLTPDEMAALVQGADLCVDATHPYAVDATRNIRTACRTAGVEYHRLLRAQSPLPAGSMVFQSAAHVADFRDPGRRGRRWLCRESAGCRRHRRPAHRDPPPGRDR